MGFLGFLKDVALLPVDVAMDVTGLSMLSDLTQDKDLESKTVKRIESMGNNLEDTYD